MTKNQALKILIRHQLWRLGSDRVKMTDAKELTAALDVAIDFMRASKQDAKTMWSGVSLATALKKVDASIKKDAQLNPMRYAKKWHFLIP
jgi:hypothetical protein